MKVLLIGSGKSALEIENADLSEHVVVVINNAWRLYPDFDYAIYASDMPEELRPVTKHEDQHLVTAWTGPKLYNRPMQPHEEYGYERCKLELREKGIHIPQTILLVSGFWCLWYLKPKLLGFIGCDLDYTPDENGHTHFYGVGRDIQLRRVPDPFRIYTQRNITLALIRMQNYAKSIGAELVNYSSHPNTLLPFKRQKLPSIGDASQNSE